MSINPDFVTVYVLTLEEGEWSLSVGSSNPHPAEKVVGVEDIALTFMHLADAFFGKMSPQAQRAYRKTMGT